MGAGGQRQALTVCAGCGRELGAVERREAHDLTLADRYTEGGRRTQRTRLHALLCDACAERMEALVISHLTAETRGQWDRSRTEAKRNP